jgi:hypothetical protein
MIRPSVLRTGVELSGVCGCPVIEIPTQINTWLTAVTGDLTTAGFTIETVGNNYRISNPNVRSVDIFSTANQKIGRLVVVKGSNYRPITGVEDANWEKLYAKFMPKQGTGGGFLDTEYWQWSINPPITQSFYLQDSPPLPLLPLWTPGSYNQNKAFQFQAFGVNTLLQAGAYHWKIETKIGNVFQHVGYLVTDGAGLESSTQRWYAPSTALVNSLLAKGGDGKWWFTATSAPSQPPTWRLVAVTSL